MRRLALPLALMAILATLLPMSLTASPASAIQQPLRSWKCGAWKGGASGATRYCAQLTSIKGVTSIDYKRVFQNQSAQRVAFTCETSKSTTWHFGGSVTVKEELGAIFAKMEASITVDISRETTTSDSASATIRVKPWGWANCKRGEVFFKVTGYTRKQSCYGGACRYSDMSSFSAKAPSSDFFAIGTGRDIDVSRFIPNP